MRNLNGKSILITGASAGIGAACAEAFAEANCRLILAARRKERLDAGVAALEKLGAQSVECIPLDVRDYDQVQAALAPIANRDTGVDVLVNNAGLSRGLDPLYEGHLPDWEEMIDTNVKGLLYVNRVVVPSMVQRGSGTVLHIGSIAGRQTYPGGNVYCATKHAVRALTEALRIDVHGSGVRVGSIDPGMVETEFSVVRFRGDEQRAETVYQDTEPLSAMDVAEAVRFAASRPHHVNLAEMLLLPTDQSSATLVHRRSKNR